MYRRRFKKKKKMQNGSTWQEMGENLNLFTYEHERLCAEQIQQALELARKRRVDYVR